MPAMDVLDDLPLSAALANSVLDKAEENAGIKLGPAERETIRMHAGTFARYCAREEAFRGSRKAKARLARTAKHLDAISSELSSLSAENPTLARYVVWPEGLDDFRHKLRTLRDALGGHLASIKHGDVPIFTGLARLLLNLEAIFTSAGGNANTGVTRKGKKRSSPFVAFAWPIINAIDVPRPSASEQALMATWEVIYSQRKKNIESGKKGLHLIRQKPKHTK